MLFLLEETLFNHLQTLCCIYFSAMGETHFIFVHNLFSSSFFARALNLGYKCTNSSCDRPIRIDSCFMHMILQVVSLFLSHRLLSECMI